MSTHTILTADIISYSHRTDLAGEIDTFIKLAELAMYDNDQHPLLVRELEFTSTTTTTGKVIATPDYFERARDLTLIENDIYSEVKPQAPNQMRKRSGTGKPCFFTVVGDQIEFDITPDSAYTVELQYYRKAPPLTALAPTNTILTNHYSIYLFGALSELFSYVQDPEQEQRYTSKFYRAIKGANKADKKGRYGPAPSMSTEGVTP